jgi:iron complex outermembrane receptor protein
MSIARCRAISLGLGVCGAALLSGGPLRAQDAASTGARTAAAADLGEVIVTARKREESILKVPVVETAIPQTQLERLQVNDVADLTKLVPGLNLGGNILTIGTQVAIRGVGSTSYDQGVDSSVGLNIDGLSLANGLAFGSGLFDLQQVEVLKGPQALFYGKSSPAGVISIRTADPTGEFELIGRAAYEVESITPRGELIVSGPVSDTLKLRLATQYSSSEGYFYNEPDPIIALGAQAPAHPRGPDSRNLKVRGTVLWDPTDSLHVRVKANFVQDDTDDASPIQLGDCPNGTIGSSGIPFLAGNDCRINRTFSIVGLNPAYFPGILHDGAPFVDSYQKFATLEVNYEVTSALTLSSTSGYYDNRSLAMVNSTSSSGAATPIAAENHFHRRDATEELRLNSDFSSPLNFTIGGLYENGLLSEDTTILGNTAYHLPPLLQDGLDTIQIRTWSAFGQARWRIFEQLELAAGDRWTDETRTQNPVNMLTGTAVVVPVRRLHSDDNSPEVTLTYTPTDELTLFAAYKKGFKSGSFSVATPVTSGLDNSFGDEKVHGGEIGLKSRLFERQLSLDIAAYDYRYTGLQVGVSEPPRNGVIVLATENAGAARTYGIDLDTVFRPQVLSGLSINGALNWNHARYVDLDNAQCWAGQTIALGCNQNLNPATGAYTAQDLSGTQMAKAPAWQLNFGASYTFEVMHGYQMTLTQSNGYMSRYPVVLAVGRPNGDNLESAFIKSDLGITLQSPNNRWEAAIIGKNLGDKITTGACAYADLANGVLFSTAASGRPTSGGGIAQATCWPDPGREVWLRVTMRPFSKD